MTENPLITALLQQDSYDHPVFDLELIETHISWVILAGDYAYKIKKPVDLGFLDFSTLEKRRVCCEEELRLNRRLAPDIYLDVIAIGGTAIKPILGQADTVFEYAVKMRRFPQEAQLDEVVARQELTAEQIDAFARLLADFHEQADAPDAETDYGEPQQVWAPMAENFSQIHELLPDREREEQLNRLKEWSEAQYQALKPLLHKRRVNGQIRECHGDLHCRNLAWLDNKPVAFDCIEFNPALRWIDVISDIAFLVMDLQERGLPELAQRFLNQYLEHTGDYQSLMVLRFYLVYRAMVRAKVAAIRSMQSGIEIKACEQALDEFGAYLDLATNYITLTKPLLIITRGLSASGKSRQSGMLLERLGAIRIRSDVERKRLFGLRAEQRANAMPGEGIYSSGAGEQTYSRLVELGGFVLQAGYPLIIDAACLQRTQREQLYALAREQKVPYLLVEFSAPLEALQQRITKRQGDASDAGLEVLAQQYDNWQPLDEDEKSHAVTIDTMREKSETALELLNAVEQYFSLQG